MSIRALWAVVCLLIFSQVLQAFSSGPPANRNGVGGVFCTACHRTYELNSGSGSVWILGLPSGWLPGETYALQVIEHTSVGSAIGSSNVFQFSYRTPDDPNFGSIRFNVAGNAANGNGNNQ